MKKITLGCSVLLAAVLIIAGCNKKTNPEPEQDKEFQSSVDVAHANSTVADLEIICSYMGENLLLSSYFVPAPGSTGTIITSRDTANNQLTVTFSSSVTCKDGKKRNGTIVMTYSSIPLANGAKFYRQPSFVASVTLNNYWVDGWWMDDVTPFKITNNMAGNYNPAADKLNWTIEGDFTIKNQADSTKNMTWKGKLIKTLTNSTSSTVFNPNKLFPIAWSTTSTTPGANIEYKGEAASKFDVSGNTSVNKPYSFKIDEEHPLIRQFSCSPDKVLGVYSTTTTPITIIPVYSEWHPFVGGVASLTTNALPEARKLDFSSEGNTDCDNSGKVTIKGIDYPIDFMK